MIYFVAEYVGISILGMCLRPVSSAERLLQLGCCGVLVVDHHGGRLDAIDVNPPDDPAVGYEDEAFAGFEVLPVFEKEILSILGIFGFHERHDLAVAALELSNFRYQLHDLMFVVIYHEDALGGILRFKNLFDLLDCLSHH
jgi:hypothetical protein